MKSMNPYPVIIVGILSFGTLASATTETFDAIKPGPLPSGWEIVVPGGYNAGKRLPGIWERDLYGLEVASKLETTPAADWQIVRDSAAFSKKNVIQAWSRATETWCVKSDVNIRDGFVEVQGKSTKAMPQHKFYKNPNEAALGVVWRYKDADNFYCAFTAGDASVKLVKRVNGSWETFEHSPYINVPAGKWHSLRVEFTASLARIFVDGSELFSAADRDLREGGAVGILIKGDSFMQFDNLSYGAFATSVTETFDAMSLGPPTTPWQHGNTLDLARNYPLGTSDWQIAMLRHPRNNVLKQSAQGCHPYCVNTDVKIRDGYVEVNAKAITGEYEQAMGIIWRWQDEKNYYILRANARSPDLALYKVVDGYRTLIQRSHDIDTPRGQWVTVRVEFSGNQIKAMWDGRELYSATDDAITGAGAVGVWTKVDSVTLFDDLSWGGN